MKSRILILFLLLLTQKVLMAQGCSDAGFCTMGAMKPDQPFNKKMEFKLRTMEISFYRGETTITPVVYVANLDLSFSLNSRNFIQVKLPYQMVKNGNLAETSGLSDISLCFTRNLISKENFDVNWSFGTKIPTNNSDLKEDGKPLPMYYQTSLGTYDLITGLSFINRQWLFATGIQHPLNANSNAFTWDDWPDYPSQDYIKRYPSANKLKRGTDVMLRVERNFRFSQLNFSLGLLPIYRITKDVREDNSGNKIKVDGSTGLALSGIATIGYNFNVRCGVKLLVGNKIIQRETNPDGLSRDFVSSISYQYRF